MTDREKLLEILSAPIYMREGADPAEAVADFLLDNLNFYLDDFCSYGERKEKNNDTDRVTEKARKAD